MLTNQSVLLNEAKPVEKPTEKEYLYHEQIKLGYEQLHVASLISISGYLTLPVLLWNQVSHFNIFFWLGACIIFVLITPYILLRRYNRADDQTRKKQYWSVWLLGVAFVSSCFWGSLGILLYPPNSLVYQIVLMFFVSVGASVATLIGASYQPLFWAKFIPNILPFSVFVLLQGDAMHTLMGLVYPFFYGTALLVLYRNLHKHLTDSLKLRFEKNHLIEQLQIKNQVAEKASAEKSRFLAAASHDLRQPLHAQMLLVDELKSMVKTEQCARTVAKLESSMNAMNGLFNELLDISKLDACTIKPNITEFPVSDLLAELALDFTQLAKNNGLPFRIHPSSFIIRSDQALLSRILRNLVSNAIRYTPKGGVLVGCRRRKKSVLIQIWDTGLGIPNSEQKHIFDEFYQLNNPERDRNKGLGLGLAIVARLSNLLQHKIRIESKIKKGSVFSIEVPLASGRTVQPKTSKENEAAHLDITGLNVLLVEDDELILSTMRELFEKWGCNVCAASSLDNAMNHLGSLISRLDLIIADYRLREKTTGIQVIDKLESALNRKVPAIIVTGDTSPQILQEINQSGRYVLHKPVTPQKLRQFISEVLTGENAIKAPLQTPLKKPINKISV